MTVPPESDDPADGRPRRPRASGRRRAGGEPDDSWADQTGSHGPTGEAGSPTGPMSRRDRTGRRGHTGEPTTGEPVGSPSAVDPTRPWWSNSTPGADRPASGSTATPGGAFSGGPGSPVWPSGPGNGDVFAPRAEPGPPPAARPRANPDLFRPGGNDQVDMFGRSNEQALSAPAPEMPIPPMPLSDRPGAEPANLPARQPYPTGPQPSGPGLVRPDLTREPYRPVPPLRKSRPDADPLYHPATPPMGTQGSTGVPTPSAFDSPAFHTSAPSAFNPPSPEPPVYPAAQPPYDPRAPYEQPALPAAYQPPVAYPPPPAPALPPVPSSGQPEQYGQAGPGQTGQFGQAAQSNPAARTGQFGQAAQPGQTGQFGRTAQPGPYPPPVDLSPSRPRVAEPPLAVPPVPPVAPVPTSLLPPPPLPIQPAPSVNSRNRREEVPEVPGRGRGTLARRGRRDPGQGKPDESGRAVVEPAGTPPRRTGGAIPTTGSFAVIEPGAPSPRTNSFPTVTPDDDGLVDVVRHQSGSPPTGPIAIGSALLPPLPGQAPKPTTRSESKSRQKSKKSSFIAFPAPEPETDAPETPGRDPLPELSDQYDPDPRAVAPGGPYDDRSWEPQDYRQNQQALKQDPYQDQRYDDQDLDDPEFDKPFASFSAETDMTDGGAAAALADAERRRQPTPPGGHGRAGRNLPAAIGVGLLLAALALASLFTRPEAFVALASIVVVLAVWELAGAMAAKQIVVPVIPLAVGSLGMLVSAYVAGEEGLLVSFTLTGFGVLLWRIIDGIEGALRDVTAGLFTAAYVPLLAGFAVLLLADGPERVVTFIVVTVASDIGGYIAGVIAGKTPMAPTISPKKSWEGFAGSVVACLIAGVGCVVFLLDGPLYVGVALGAAAAVTATLGDLSESLLKRDLGVKDMGSLLPGHGGIMDRLDSLLPTAPVAYLLLHFLVSTT